MSPMMMLNPGNRVCLGGAKVCGVNDNNNGPADHLNGHLWDLGGMLLVVDAKLKLGKLVRMRLVNKFFDNDHHHQHHDCHYHEHVALCCSSLV